MCTKIKGLLLTIFLLHFCALFAQNKSLAQELYLNNNYQEAVVLYEELLEKKPKSSNYITIIADCYRNLEAFDKAHKVLDKALLQNPNQYIYLLEKGQTYNLEKKTTQAQKTFQKLLSTLEKNPKRLAFYAQQFKKYLLLEEAVFCYELLQKNKYNANYDYELARLYGSLSQKEKMFEAYLNYTQNNPSRLAIVKRRLQEFTSVDANSESNLLLKKILFKRIQNTPITTYNELLSWLFIQEKDYTKAFLQERALYKRTHQSPMGLLGLARIALEDKEIESSKNTLKYLIQNSSLTSYVLEAHQMLLKIESEQALNDLNKQVVVRETYERLIKEYKSHPKSIELTLDYAYFLAFKQNERKEAINILKELRKKPHINDLKKAKAEILLADVLLLNNQFNEALINYARATEHAKNHPVAQEANFKVAKASYYTGDFKWALTQLNVLKASTTQLIANDAMKLALLIEDYMDKEYTNEALARFAKADLLNFQEKPDKALEVYETLIDAQDAKTLQDAILYHKAQLLYEQKKYSQSLESTQKLIKNHSNSLYFDDILYLQAKLHETLENIEAAKQSYKQLVFNHQDSIYYTDARKAYRRLTGE